MGKTALVVGFAKDIPLILAKNPHLNFGVSALPQPEGAAITINYGTYNFLSVSRLSKNPDVAWKFAVFAASKDINFNYLLASSLPPARRDLVHPPKKISDNLMPFFNQSLSAVNWLKPDENGISAIFSDMIEFSLSRKFSFNSAVVQANDRINQLLKK